jgi:imidazolonepropionase-like amidohydrolase
LLSTRRAIAAGVTLVNGTDIPPGDLVDGIPAALHELLLMAAAGLDPLRCLQSISLHAARLLRIDSHVGQLRPGFAGDLIAVSANPLRDLDTMRDISLVVQGGQLIRDRLVS